MDDSKEWKLNLRLPKDRMVFGMCRNNLAPVPDRSSRVGGGSGIIGLS